MGESPKKLDSGDQKEVITVNAYNWQQSAVYWQDSAIYWRKEYYSLLELGTPPSTPPHRDIPLDIPR